MTSALLEMHANTMPAEMQRRWTASGVFPAIGS
jgi:hypothetical protein